jgi:hypothetical protein
MAAGLLQGGAAPGSTAHGQCEWSRHRVRGAQQRAQQSQRRTCGDEQCHHLLQHRGVGWPQPHPGGQLLQQQRSGHRLHARQAASGDQTRGQQLATQRAPLSSAQVGLLQAAVVTHGVHACRMQ